MIPPIRRLTPLAAASLTLASPLALSQSADTLDGVRIDAKLKDAPPPTYPPTALQEAREGWVILSVVVSEDGQVIEPMIEDSSGNPDFERAALRASENWSFTPATVDDAPVEQALTQVKVIFQLDTTTKGRASTPFQRRYEDIVELLGRGEFETANELIADLQYTEKHNLYEDAWFWWLKYQYLDASGSVDEREMRDSLRKAVGYEDNYLPPDVFVVAAQRLYVLEVETGDLGGALKTFERLRDSEDARESENYAQSIEVLGAHVERIRDLAEGPDLLAFAGEVGAFDYWVHNLLRRSFSIRGVDGELEIVDIRCSRGTVRYPWGSEDDVWNVPESWGDCGVYVKGAVGTKFSLYEYPAEA